MVFLRRQSAPAPTPPPEVASETPAEAPISGRPAPEPLTLVLPALAALGAVASIAAVAFMAQDREADRPRVKRRIDVILKDLETACLGLGEILRRVRRHARQLGFDGPAGTVPMKLGLVGGRVEPAAGQLYHQLVNDLATMLVLATQNSFDAVNAIEDGEIEAPDDLLFAFGAAQERLNTLLVQRANLRTTVDTSIEIAAQMTVLVQRLKGLKRAGGTAGAT